MNIRIISAGAGSGKTYRLTQEMVALLRGGMRASGIIATTFTQKAAAELQDRVRVRLLEEGLSRQADELTNALIGTVHGLGVKLLRRFAYEAGVSPEATIIAEEDQQVLFNQSLSTVLTEERVERMDALCARLGLNTEYFDWRREVRNVTEVARANDFSIALLNRSCEQSVESFLSFLQEPDGRSEELWNAELQKLLSQTIDALQSQEDGTKLTREAVKQLRSLLRELDLQGWLPWPEWARIGKITVAVKSRDHAEELIAFARSCESHPGLHRDIAEFIRQIFDLASAAIREYDDYKNRRGLIDYTDMEVRVNRLLDHEEVREILRGELDLLLIDEFQDTSPIQLELFLKLSRMARHSIWVGDPKQSIYGFRGADPRLMQAIIDQTGGVRPEDIQRDSWRSREDLVLACNALFTKAFSHTPPEQVALRPKRKNDQDPIEAENALQHWHLMYDGEGKRQPGRPWMENALAATLKSWLSVPRYILPKGEKQYRPARPGEVAILCRSNRECQEIAGALARAGLEAAISRAGLLHTAEAKLVLACLKYMLHRQDSLSVAEILLLGAGWTTEQIIEHRLDYLEGTAEILPPPPWATEQPIISQLDQLREAVVELSSAEMLDLLLEELDLRRIIVSWGNSQQRLDNVDVLRSLALRYEEACNRLHSAASLGGFLLWINELHQGGQDMQGSGEGPQAVNVLTYHRSKGLEWPVVICYNLDQKLRADVWGIDIVPERPEVDLDQVLAHRWLRYWVNPFDRQIRGTPLDERLAASQAQAQKTIEARQEEARLLYVGLTRARDYLIFPTSSTPSRWLNRVWHGDEDTPTLLADTHESPWSWEGRHLDLHTQTFLYPKDFPLAEPAVATARYPAQRPGPGVHIPFRIDLREEELYRVYKPQAGPQIQYGSAFSLKEEADRQRLLRLFREFMGAFYPEDDHSSQLETAEAYLRRFEATALTDAGKLVQHGRQFFQFLQQHFRISRLHRGFFIRYFYQHRLFETTLDFVLETDAGPVLIQHARFHGDSANKQEALRLADYLFLSKLALQEWFDSQEVKTLVHFPLGGYLLEVDIQKSLII